MKSSDVVREGLLVAALVALCLGLAFGQQEYQVAGDRAGVLYRSGRVEVLTSSSAGWRACAEGELLGPGDRVRTGPESSAALVLYDQTVMKLGEETELVLVDLTQDGTSLVRRFRLELGRVWSDVTPMKDPGSVFEIEGPDAVAAVKGTAFEVDVDGTGTDVLVWEGSVQARALSGGPHGLIGEGSGFAHNRFTARRGGSVRWSRFDHARADPWQRWNLENRRRLQQVMRSGRLTADQLLVLKSRFQQVPAPRRQRVLRSPGPVKGPGPAGARR